jgi:hypothetical protein
LHVLNADQRMSESDRLRTLGMTKCAFEPRMTGSDRDFNRWMQHLLSGYREEDVVDEVPEEDLLHRSGQGAKASSQRMAASAAAPC